MSVKNKRYYNSFRKISPLKFTEEERRNSTLSKDIEKIEKKYNKLNKKYSKIPKKKTAKINHYFDLNTGTNKVRLYFEETEKPKPNSKIYTNVKSMPKRFFRNKINNELSKYEKDNTALEATTTSEKIIETTSKHIKNTFHSHALRQYKNFEKAEKETIKAEIDYIYKKDVKENPSKYSNPISKMYQKRALKKKYMAYRYGNQGENINKNIIINSISNFKNATIRLSKCIINNKKLLLVSIFLIFIILFVSSIISSCSIIFKGGINSIISTSYTSEDEDIIATDNAYTILENKLKERIDNIKTEYPGYDEYRFDVDVIGHNPHELASYLTALLHYYKENQVKEELQRVFDCQYKLTITKTVEVRYRTKRKTDNNGNSYSVRVPYNYYILNIKLDNFSISKAAENFLTDEQFEMYTVYLETKGNKPLIFGGGTSDLSPSTDLSGVIFESGSREGNIDIVNIALSQEGNLGGEPYWSWYGFKSRVEWCACFVSWCINQAGYSEPKFAACHAQGIPQFKSMGQWVQGNYNSPAPGDIIFFDWENDGHSDHVGIVIGTDGEKVYTVEGNSGDVCRVRSYDINSNVIFGYGLMN